MSAPIAVQTDFIPLPPADIRLVRDEFERLNISVAGTTHTGVRAVRPFPLTSPENCVFILDSDGKEVGMVEDVAALEPSSRDLLRASLDLDYFCTRVLSVKSVKSRHGVSSWVMVTPRGERTVHVKDRSDIRKLPGGRMILTDIDGLRFEIESISKLDDRSQTLIESET